MNQNPDPANPMLTAILSGVVQNVITQYVQENSQGDSKIVISDDQVAELSGKLVQKAQELMSAQFG
jgi:hypothetical protein